MTTKKTPPPMVTFGQGYSRKSGVQIQQQQQAKADVTVTRWNATIPVGTLVEYEEVLGKSGKIRAVTASEAWNMSGRVMVKLEGKAGGVAVDHITGWH